MIDPNTDFLTISNELLLKEFNSPKTYNRINLYALMARRANFNQKIKKRLFKQILDKEARKEVLVGTIKHAWIPVTYILQEGTDNLKLELKNVLNKWSLIEKKTFLDYIKTEQEYYTLLSDIIDKN